MDGPRTPELPPQRPPEKAHSGKKAVKGFYYFAAEYQRKKQTERKSKIHKIVRGVIEPFAIHIRAYRLWRSSLRYGGGGSAVLDTEFVKRALDGFLGSRFRDEAGKKVADSFKAKSQAHGILEKAKGVEMSDDERKKAVEVINSLLQNKTPLTSEQLKKFADEMGVDTSTIQSLGSVLIDARDKGLIQTTEDMKEKVGDEILFGGLKPDQYERAKKLARSAKAMTVAALLNLGKIPLLVALSVNPLGWAAIAGSAGLSFASRFSRLVTEGHTHDISKSRGIDVAHKVRGLERILGIDWDEDPQHRGRQLFRAATAGALMGLALKFAGPGILEAVHNPGEVFHNINDHLPWAHHGGNTNIEKYTTSSPVSSEHLTKVSYSDYLNHHSVHNVNVTHDPNAPHGATWAYGEHDQAIYDPHTHQVIGLEVNKFGNAEGANVMYVNANGHNVVLQLPADGKINLIPGGDNKVMELVDEKWNPVTGQLDKVTPFWQETTSGNVCQEMGITKAGLDNWVNHGNPAGVSTDWDYTNGQTVSGYNFSLANYTLDANGHTANIDILATAQGHGHVDTNAFFLQKSYSTLPHDSDYPFHSGISPQLEKADNWTDQLHIGNWPVGETIDPAIDFSLHNADDWIALWQSSPGLAVAEAALLGVPGYILARYRKQHGPSVKDRIGIGTMAALSVLMPGVGIPMLAGYGVGRIGKKKKKEETKKSGESTETKQSESDNNPTPKAPQPPTAPSDQAQSTQTLPPTNSGTPEKVPSVAPVATSESGKAVPSPAPLPNIPNTLPAAPEGGQGVEATAPIVPPPTSNPEEGSTETVPATAPVATPDQQTVVKGFLERLKNNEFFKHIAELETLGTFELAAEQRLGHIIDSSTRLHHAISSILHKIGEGVKQPNEINETIEKVFEKLKGEAKDKRLLDFIHLAEFAGLFYRLRSHPEILDKVKQVIAKNSSQGVANVMNDLRAMGETVPSEIATVAGEAGEEALPLLEDLAPLLA